MIFPKIFTGNDSSHPRFNSRFVPTPWMLRWRGKFLLISRKIAIPLIVVYALFIHRPRLDGFVHFLCERRIFDDSFDLLFPPLKDEQDVVQHEKGEATTARSSSPPDLGYYRQRRSVSFVDDYKQYGQAVLADDQYLQAKHQKDESSTRYHRLAKQMSPWMEPSSDPEGSCGIQLAFADYWLFALGSVVFQARGPKSTTGDLVGSPDKLVQTKRVNFFGLLKGFWFEY